MRPRTLAAALLLAASAPGAGGAPVPAATLLAVKASRLHLADGRTLADAVVIVKDGLVAAVGSGLPIPAGATVREVPDASAGFADLWSRAPGGNDAEDPRPFAPSLRAADGLDPRDGAAAAAAREGVLARLLLPSDRNPAGGRAAAIRVAGGDGRLAVVSADAGGVFSLCGVAERRERYPGSLAGILRGLESIFDAAAGTRSPFGGADPALALGAADRAALAGLPGGKVPAFLYARSRPEVAAALRFAADRKLRPVLVDPRCGADAVLGAAAAAGIAPADLSAVILLDLDDPLFHLRAAGALAKAGVAVGFGAGGPWRGPGAIRRAAALAVRHGMDPGAALGALLGRGFGTLRADPAGVVLGEPADLVLLDGDPVEPATRVLGVLAGGESVERRAKGNSINE